MNLMYKTAASSLRQSVESNENAWDSNLSASGAAT